MSYEVSQTTGHRWSVISVRQHLLGIILIAAAFSFLALLPLLPNSASGDVGELPFLQRIEEPYVLAFMGYPGCSTICPGTLSYLRQAYVELSEGNNPVPVKVMFVNIELGMPDAVSANYAKQYHKNFGGYSIKPDESEVIYRALSLRTYDNSEQAENHAGWVYQFRKKNYSWELQRVHFELPELNIFVNEIQKDYSLL